MLPSQETTRKLASQREELSVQVVVKELEVSRKARSVEDYIMHAFFTPSLLLQTNETRDSAISLMTLSSGGGDQSDRLDDVSSISTSSSASKFSWVIFLPCFGPSLVLYVVAQAYLNRQLTGQTAKSPPTRPWRRRPKDPPRRITTNSPRRGSRVTWSSSGETKVGLESCI